MTLNAHSKILLCECVDKERKEFFLTLFRSFIRRILYFIVGIHLHGQVAALLFGVLCTSCQQKSKEEGSNKALLKNRKPLVYYRQEKLCNNCYNQKFRFAH